tara:strand:+ start:51484 stop:52206 length:723 start_codon:yes stop_codon:yes gene_type:complete
MGFFETIGVLVSIAVAVWLTNHFLDEYKRVNSAADEMRRKSDEFSREKMVREQQYMQWAFDNPEEAKLRESQEQQRVESNTKHREEVDALYDLMQEIQYLERSGRLEHFEYLMSFKGIGVSNYWNGVGVSFPLESDKSVNVSFDALPWRDFCENRNSDVTGLTPEKLAKIYSIPVCELALLYKHYQLQIDTTKLSGEMKDISNWHQFILGQIDRDLIALKEIAEKRSTEPAYARRQRTET